MAGRKQPQRKPRGVIKPSPPPAPPRRAQIGTVNNPTPSKASTPVTARSPDGRSVLYDGLKPGQRSWLKTDRAHPLELVSRTSESKAVIERTMMGPGIMHPDNPRPWIMPFDVIKLGDLEDGSERSRILKGHLEGGLCRLVD